MRKRKRVRENMIESDGNGVIKATTCTNTNTNTNANTNARTHGTDEMDGADVKGEYTTTKMPTSSRQLLLMRS